MAERKIFFMPLRLNSTANKPAAFKKTQKIFLLSLPGFAYGTASGHDNNVKARRDPVAKADYLSYLSADAVSFHSAAQLFACRYADPARPDTVLAVIHGEHSRNTFFSSVIEPLKVSVVLKDCRFHCQILLSE